MRAFRRTRRHAGASLSIFALAAGAFVAVGLSVTEADAQGGVFRRGAAVGENGAVARSGGLVTNGEGSGAVRRGAFATDGQGSAAGARGGCANGANGSGCAGRGFTRNSDGSASARRGAEYSGENGSFSGRSALNRDSDGSWSGSRSVDAAGQSGAYSGASSFGDGAYNREGVYTDSDGQSATVQGSYERGVGGSRSVTCTNASGVVVDCP